MIADLSGFSNAFIKQWILSDDPLEGDLWDEICIQLGLDPDTLASMTERARKRYPRLKCGHYDLEGNVYIRHGRKQCKLCAAWRSESSNKLGLLNNGTDDSD